jgi:hypothetical protein
MSESFIKTVIRDDAEQTDDDMIRREYRGLESVASFEGEQIDTKGGDDNGTK